MIEIGPNLMQAIQAVCICSFLGAYFYFLLRRTK